MTGFFIRGMKMNFFSVHRKLPLSTLTMKYRWFMISGEVSEGGYYPMLRDLVKCLPMRGLTMVICYIMYVHFVEI